MLTVKKSLLRAELSSAENFDIEYYLSMGFLGISERYLDCTGLLRRDAPRNDNTYKNVPKESLSIEFKCKLTYQKNIT